jgi:hypothetical protein
MMKRIAHTAFHGNARERRQSHRIVDLTSSVSAAVGERGRGGAVGPSYRGGVRSDEDLALFVV